MSVQLAKVRIDARGMGTIELDGQPVHGVRSVTVRTEAGCRPVIVLEINAREVDLKQSGPQPAGEVGDAPA